MKRCRVCDNCCAGLLGLHHGSEVTLEACEVRNNGMIQSVVLEGAEVVMDEETKVVEGSGVGGGLGKGEWGRERGEGEAACAEVVRWRDGGQGVETVREGVAGGGEEGEEEGEGDEEQEDRNERRKEGGGSERRGGHGGKGADEDSRQGREEEDLLEDMGQFPLGYHLDAIERLRQHDIALAASSEALTQLADMSDALNTEEQRRRVMVWLRASG